MIKTFEELMVELKAVHDSIMHAMTWIEKLDGCWIGLPYHARLDLRKTVIRLIEQNDHGLQLEIRTLQTLRATDAIPDEMRTKWVIEMRTRIFECQFRGRRLVELLA